MTPVRLAVVASHPVQYYAPWFRVLAATRELEVRVYYLWDFGVDRGAGGKVDEKFGVGVTWDVPLLKGYEWEFVPNVSGDPGTHRFGGLDNPSLGRRLAAFCPDVVLVFGYFYKSLQRLILWDRPRGAALFFRGDSHDLDPGQAGLKERLKRRLTASVFSRFDRFLAVGEANAEYFRARGVGDDRITFVPHCVDNARFADAGTIESAADLRSELNLPTDALVGLFVGKFESKKSPVTVVKAFRNASVPSSALLMVGSGALEAECREAADGDERVRFLGFRNQTEMPAAYAAADLLVLPSRGRSETWGLSVNEAFACGTPAIVSNVVGCGPDLIAGRDTGTIVPAEDEAALAGALRTALSDRETLIQWGQNARKVVAEYSYETARDGLLRALAAEGLGPGPSAMTA